MRRILVVAVALGIGAACMSSPSPPADPSALHQAACAHAIRAGTDGQVASSALLETSGVVASRANTDVLWAHNDSGDTARVFAMTTAGAHLGIFQLAGTLAVDWEDIALGPGPDAGTSYLYLGDIGDNAAARPSVVVYRVAEPTVDAQDPPGDVNPLTGVTAITLQYPDGAHDAEALLVDPRSGDIVIVTKEASGNAGVYARAGGTSGTLTKKTTVSLGAGVLVTGGDVAPDGTGVVLRTYSSVLVYSRPNGRPLTDAFGSKACTGASATEQQGEAIGVLPDGRGYVTVSEGTNPPVHRFDIAG